MLLALAGLAGAGKSTAIAILEGLGFGRRYYAGQAIRDEVLARRLALTPENERAVRVGMRDAHGMDVFARLSLPRPRELAAKGPVLLDSIYCVEERDLYREAFGAKAKVLSIVAARGIRETRLAIREERKMTPEQLARRDALELGRYRLGEVIESAEHPIANEGRLDDFEQVLRHLLARLRG